MGNCLFSSSVEKEVSRHKLASDEFISKLCGEISYNIGSDWLRWGRHLGLSDADLDNIRSDNKNCYEKADNVFKKWKQKNGNPSWEQLKKKLMDFDRLDIVNKIETKFRDHLSNGLESFPDFDFFYECFYESQLSLFDIIYFVDERNEGRSNKSNYYGWKISIEDGKTSYATSCDIYFINYYKNHFSHFCKTKLEWLRVHKNILNDEEKNLLIQCSTNVRVVSFSRPINFDGWKPKHKIEVLYICISDYLITKKDFEENFLPWILLCDELKLSLHDDIDFIKNICEWIRCSNIKLFNIEHRGKFFYNLYELSYNAEKC
ncbi:uncharacterized protein LOC105848095 [Hydra vulgaris]|uniref:uncharacterized protein LOC105848095 n=1 Tax=Hydra vulgaris TaxID=6087 RepID=UPI001F5F8127|nr:uncharacterized protein LOC105848095 [Hydra vulgaris]XP_047131256.1 uncharacterized protein LOC105848095 [Hydra vulgaris]